MNEIYLDWRSVTSLYNQWAVEDDCGYPNTPISPNTANLKGVGSPTFRGVVKFRTLLIRPSIPYV